MSKIYYNIYIYMSMGDNKNGCMHKIAFFIGLKLIAYDFLLVNKLVNHFLVLWGNRNICADRKISLINKINSMKFVRNQKVELKKSFKLYRQISSKDPMKVGLNFVQFASMKVCKMKPKKVYAHNFHIMSPKFKRFEWVQKLGDLNESKNYAVKFWIVPKQKHEIMKWNQMG